MRNVSSPQQLALVPLSLAESNAEDVASPRKGLDPRNPAQLSELLQEHAIQRNPDFLEVPENELRYLRADSACRFLLLEVLLCPAVAFHSVETDSWYVFHGFKDHERLPVEFLENLIEDSMFNCDKFIIINLSSTPSDDLDEVRQTAVEMVIRSGGLIAKNAEKRVDLGFTQSLRERLDGAVTATRAIVLAPEAHSLYVFDENRRHVDTYPL